MFIYVYIDIYGWNQWHKWTLQHGWKVSHGQNWQNGEIPSQGWNYIHGYKNHCSHLFIYFLNLSKVYGFKPFIK